MSVVFRCSHCGAAYRVPDHLAGRLARCRHCRGVSRITPSGGKAGGHADSHAADTPGHEVAPEVHHDVEHVPEHAAAQEGPARTSVEDILEAVREETGAAAGAAGTHVAAPPADTTMQHLHSHGALPARPEEAEHKPKTVLTWRMQLAACAAGFVIGTAVLALTMPWKRWVGLSRTARQETAAVAAQVSPPHHSSADASEQAGPPDVRRMHYRQCVANMERLGQALRLYAALNRGQFPYELSRLAVSKSASFAPVPAEAFICPATGRKVPPGLSDERLVHWLSKHSDYVFRGAGWGPGAGGVPPIIIHEKWESDSDEGVNVLDDQFVVRFMSLADLKSALRQQQKYHPNRVAAME